MSIFWSVKNVESLKDKIIIVTGGNSGLGFEDVKYYASKGACVILACRNPEKGEEAKNQIIRSNPDAEIDVMQLDLADLSSIREFSRLFRMRYKRLDILMNNAGIMVTPYEKTKDGFESQFGVNHLGHFALTGLLFEILKHTPHSRIVTISSMAHTPGTMNFDNLMYEKGGYKPFKAYARSKLANLLFTYELQRRIEKNKLDMKALAAHPGGSRTSLFRHIKKTIFTYLFYPFFFVFTQSAYRGALSGIRSALDEKAKGGSFYGPIFYLIGPSVKVASNYISYDRVVAKRLWQISEKLTRVHFEF